MFWFAYVNELSTIDLRPVGHDFCTVQPLLTGNLARIAQTVCGCFVFFRFGIFQQQPPVVKFLLKHFIYPFFWKLFEAISVWLCFAFFNLTETF